MSTEIPLAYTVPLNPSLTGATDLLSQRKLDQSFMRYCNPEKPIDVAMSAIIPNIPENDNVILEASKIRPLLGHVVGGRAIVPLQIDLRSALRLQPGKTENHYAAPALARVSKPAPLEMNGLEAVASPSDDLRRDKKEKKKSKDKSKDKKEKRNKDDGGHKHKRHKSDRKEDAKPIV